jgi:hypothetical protein
MTPELKTACEVVFQEHKLSHDPINWKKVVFRRRISLALSDLAKETLVKEQVILFPNRAKKIVTVLNPAVAKAATFEEAAAMIKNGNFSPVQLSAEAKPIVVALPPTKEEPVFKDAPVIKQSPVVKETALVKETAVVKEQPVVKERPAIKEVEKQYQKPLRVATDNGTTAAGLKWYMKPVFYYVVWPLCALLICIAISYLLGSTDI